MYMDVPRHISRGSEQMKHEILNIRGWQPSGTETYGDFTGPKVSGLHTLQRFHVDGVILRIQFCTAPCPYELFPHVAAEIIIGGQILFLCVSAVAMHGIQEDDAFQISVDLLLGLSRQFLHEGHVYLGSLCE